MIGRKLFYLAFGVVACCGQAYAQQMDVVPIFNGRDLTGWTEMLWAEQGHLYHQAVQGQWAVRDSNLVSIGTKSGWAWLKSETQYTDFELEFEYNLAPGAKTGICIRCPGIGDLITSGLVVCIMDEDIETGLSGRLYLGTGGIIGAVRPKPVTQRPVGQWNSMRIRCEGDHVQAAINRTIAVDIDMSQYESLSYRPWCGFIGFANENGGARGTAFRNIRIRELTVAQRTTELAKR